MDELLITSSGTEFNPEIVKQHGLIRAKYRSWKAFRNGLITFVQGDVATALFQTGVNATTSYYRIKASEVESGLWEIFYTNDFETFYRTEDTQNGTN